MSTPPGGKMFVGGGMPLCVPKDAKNPMGGFKYITYFRCTMDGVAFSRDNFGDVADIKEAYEDPAFHTTPQDMRDYFQCDVLEPVSYTHLDVYKRQLQGVMKRLIELGKQELFQSAGFSKNLIKLCELNP